VQTYLVVERPERLEAPGGEFEILHGAVMSAKGLEAWAPRHLETAPETPFVALADAARARGYALFALPSSAPPSDATGLVSQELTLAEARKVLVRHRADWQGNAQVRWIGEHGGTVELEAPGWLLREIADTRTECAKLRAEADAAVSRLADAQKALEGERAENARLKAGMVLPASATKGRGRKRDASPAIAPEAPVAADGSKTVADVKADLAATLEAEAQKVAQAPKKKYRGTAGDD